MVVLRRIWLLHPVALVGSPPVAGVFTYAQLRGGKSCFDWSCVCVCVCSGTFWGRHTPGCCNRGTVHTPVSHTSCSPWALRGCWGAEGWSGHCCPPRAPLILAPFLSAHQGSELLFISGTNKPVPGITAGDFLWTCPCKVLHPHPALGLPPR